MCTVTLFPSGTYAKGFILTSNRDEAPERVAILPDFYYVENVKMLFPKDRVAGGTWIGISEQSRLICLLNGGFEAHIRKDDYRKSRGVVVKELLAAPETDAALEDYLLEGIEPFTIILIDWKYHLRFLEFVWDGNDRHIRELPLKPHIWSSSPLYNKEMRQRRIGWFKQFLRGSFSSEEILEFHHTGGDGRIETDLIMDRGFIKTQSITQIENFKSFCQMVYEDLSEKKIEKLKFNFN